MTDFGKVAVLMGGFSAEREVSLKSGNAVLKALLSKGVNAVGIDVNRQILEVLTKEKFDRVFIALHGRGGEDGLIQGALEILQIPYTGSGVLASALGMNKYKTKQIWQSIGIPTPAYRLVSSDTECKEVLKNFTLPLMIKPLNEGSSIGMSKVSHRDDLVPAWRKAAQYGPVLIEEFIEGSEFTAAILQEEALPLIRVEVDKTKVFYDYNAKYFSNETKYLCPCGLEKTQEKELQEMAFKAYQTVGAKSWGRVDFLLDHAQKPWFIEINTVPGMTDHSLVPMAAKAAGINFEDLVWLILETTL